MIPQELIVRKRDGAELSTADIRDFVAGVVDGRFSHAQAASMLMACFLRGLSARETADLTRAMVQSGECLDLSSIDMPVVDKHSTGGVGDKVSLPLAPLVAECGVCVPMISGRGLGHTGGTLDKLQSIPGYRADIHGAALLAVLRKTGCAIVGQSRDLAPADRILYALRDATGTVESIPLICASILSKKAAEDLDALVLDVKSGSGAFMPTHERSLELARRLCEVGAELGLDTRALVTSMAQPLGETIGNALEVAESVALLRGEGPADLLEVTLALGAEMLCAARVAPAAAAARARLREALDSGRALARFAAMIEAQGGDPRVTDDPAAHLPQAARVVELRVAPEHAGWCVAAIDARAVGMAALVLGAGRTREDQSIDPAAGIDRIVKIGARVSAGDRLARLHGAASADFAEAERRLRAAIRFAPDAPSAPPELILTRIEPEQRP